MIDLADKLREARCVLKNAIEIYAPKHIVGLFSGGHDSLTVTHFAAKALGKRLDGVVHVNTGIGIPETRQFVRETCKRFGWNLLEYKATENVNAKGEADPMVYESIVQKHGFPGPFAHRMMYSCLKERQIRRLARDFGCNHKEPIMLISGCRKEESSRRMGTTKVCDKQGRFLWVSPFAEMTALDCSDYMEREGLPRNPVKDVLHMSGECLCGAFAHPGELAEIEMWYPETAEHIRGIEAKVKAAGHGWGWEDKPPRRPKNEAQMDMLHLCTGCGKRPESIQDSPPIELTSIYDQYCWEHGENAAGKIGGMWLKSHCQDCETEQRSECSHENPVETSADVWLCEDCGAESVGAPFAKPEQDSDE